MDENVLVNAFDFILNIIYIIYISNIRVCILIAFFSYLIYSILKRFEYDQHCDFFHCKELEMLRHLFLQFLTTRLP